MNYKLLFIRFSLVIFLDLNMLGETSYPSSVSYSFKNIFLSFINKKIY